MSELWSYFRAFGAAFKELTEGWIGSITANYVSNVTWIIFGLATAKIFWFIADKYSFERRILHARRKDKCLLTYGIILETISKHKYSAVEEGDGNALARTYSKIAKIFQPESITTINSNEIEGLLGRSDFVVSLSGPVWNKTTEFLLGRCGSPAWIESEKGLVYKKDGSVKSLKTQYNENTTPTTCYGVLLCTTRLIAGVHKQRILVLFGLSNLSTYAASVLFEKLKIYIRRKYNIFRRNWLFRKKFCIIFKVDSRYIKSRSGDSFYLSEDQSEIEIIDVISSKGFQESWDYSYKNNKGVHN